MKNLLKNQKQELENIFEKIRQGETVTDEEIEQFNIIDYLFILNDEYRKEADEALKRKMELPPKKSGLTMDNILDRMATRAENEMRITGYILEFNHGYSLIKDMIHTELKKIDDDNVKDDPEIIFDDVLEMLKEKYNYYAEENAIAFYKNDVNFDTWDEVLEYFDVYE